MYICIYIYVYIYKCIYICIYIYIICIYKYNFDKMQIVYRSVVLKIIYVTVLKHDSLGKHDMSSLVKLTDNINY